MKNVIVSRESKAHAFLEFAIELHLLGERPKLDAFYCMLRSGREFKSLWPVFPPVPIHFFHIRNLEQGSQTQHS